MPTSHRVLPPLKKFAAPCLSGLLAALALCGCATASAGSQGFSPANGKFLKPASVKTVPVQGSPTCSGSFQEQLFDYITTPSTKEVHQFESNGTGVAINDLNNDGLLDLVFANLNGPSSIYWNRGNFQFDMQPLEDRHAHAVQIIDVDGDGWQDITFTHVSVGLSYWHNTAAPDSTGRPGFERKALPHVTNFAHSMAWGDLNGDNQLDVVTGSYDAELNLQPGGSFLFTDGAGVYLYEQDNLNFRPIRLAKKSQALAIALFDANQDAKPDILVGNDFDFPDQAWVKSGNEWKATSLFSRSSQHTMSLDWGDINNNGDYEVFATDMNPYQVNLDELAQWVPMMRTMPHRLLNTDAQRAQNVLQILSSAGSYQDEAGVRGVIAAGWGWSGKFADLDNDGYLDLYVVNGMIDQELFAYLPGGELREENQAFRNEKDGTFTPAAEWKLSSISSGRGMSIADLNNDGKLDIVVNNLRSNAALFKNQLCEGSSLQVELTWPGSKNSHALGARLLLHTGAGSLLRDIRSGSGYLSGDAARVHFGFPSGTKIDSLDILWPDGEVSHIENPTPDSILTIVR